MVDCAPSRRTPFAATAGYVSRILNSPMPPRPEPLWTSDALYERTMRPSFPATVIVLYLAGVLLLNGRNRRDRTKTPIARTLVILHNLALAVYSAWTFVTITPPIAKAFMQPLFSSDSFRRVFCGVDDGLWIHTIAPVSYLFYLSKVYEIVDSIILLAKGRDVSTLQTFHHAGAIACMYAGVRYQGMPIWIFSVANSFIHTLMYTYYTLTALHLPFPKPLKRALTSMQISQFIVGGSIAASYLFVKLPEPINSSRRCLPRSEARFAVKLNLIYLAPLIMLFVDFARRTYGKRVKTA